MAAARAFAAGQPLWRYLTPDRVTPRLPVRHFNVVNGGVHAPNSLDFQEFMIDPLGAPSLAEAVRAGAEVYAALRHRRATAGHTTGLGDEGGFAPDITAPEDVLAELVEAITDAGYALDPAASKFHRDGIYHVAGDKLTTHDTINRYEEIVARYPVWSIEDGLAEDDWAGWTALTERLADRIQIVGDDLLVTNPAIVAEAIAAAGRNRRPDQGQPDRHRRRNAAHHAAVR
jgi:enolase